MFSNELHLTAKEIQILIDLQVTLSNPPISVKNNQAFPALVPVPSLHFIALLAPCIFHPAERRTRSNVQAVR